MSDFAVLGLAMTLMYLLNYGIKSSQWRLRLGLAITASGVIACFNLPFHAYGTNVGLIYIFSCAIGLFLIADSDRFEDNDTT